MEKVVLKQIKEGMTSKEIADKLCVSISTVKNHRHNITTKIGLSTKTHSLVNWVMQNKELI
jgi:DNA-binding CsgD family transcriptional regulator